MDIVESPPDPVVPLESGFQPGKSPKKTIPNLKFPLPQSPWTRVLDGLSRHGGKDGEFHCEGSTTGLAVLHHSRGAKPAPAVLVKSWVAFGLRNNPPQEQGHPAMEHHNEPEFFTCESDLDTGAQHTVLEWITSTFGPLDEIFAQTEDRDEVALPSEAQEWAQIRESYEEQSQYVKTLAQNVETLRRLWESGPFSKDALARGNQHLIELNQMVETLGRAVEQGELNQMTQVFCASIPDVSAHFEGQGKQEYIKTPEQVEATRQSRIIQANEAFEQARTHLPQEYFDIQQKLTTDIYKLSTGDLKTLPPKLRFNKPVVEVVQEPVVVEHLLLDPCFEFLNLLGKSYSEIFQEVLLEPFPFQGIQRPKNCGVLSWGTKNTGNATLTCELMAENRYNFQILVKSTQGTHAILDVKSLTKQELEDRLNNLREWLVQVFT